MEPWESLVALGAGAGGMTFGTMVVIGTRRANSGRWAEAARLHLAAAVGFAGLAAYNAFLRPGWWGWLLMTIEATAAAVSAVLGGIALEASGRRRRPPRWDGRGDYP